MREQYCKKRVTSQGGWYTAQCSRKSIKDGFCKQHHPNAEESRRKKTDKKREDKKRSELAGHTYWFIEDFATERELKIIIEKCQTKLKKV